MTTPAVPPDNPRPCEIGDTDYGFSQCIRNAVFCVTQQTEVVGMPTDARLFSCSQHLPSAAGFVQSSSEARRPVFVYWQPTGFLPDLSEKPVKERFRGAVVEGVQVPAAGLEDTQVMEAVPAEPEGA